MTCSYRRLILPITAFLLIMLLASSGLARAQDDDGQEAAITLARLRIELWPEFDRPSVLVIYSGQVAGASGEVTLSFAMPEGATFNAAAYTDPQTGDLLQAQNSLDGGVVTMTSPNGTFHVEFYDPNFDASPAERSYTYTWGGEYAVTSMDWFVQQPPTAQGFATEPAGVATSGSFGLTYQVVTVGEVAAGETASVTLRYTKADDTLTADLLSLASATPEESTSQESSTPPGTINTTTVLVTVLVLVGIGLIGGGLYLYNRSREEEEETLLPRAAQRKGSRRQSGRRATAAASGSAPRFCTNCGRPVADSSDRFCRHCGAPLRR